MGIGGNLAEIACPSENRGVSRKNAAALGASGVTVEEPGHAGGGRLNVFFGRRPQLPVGFLQEIAAQAPGSVVGHPEEGLRDRFLFRDDSGPGRFTGIDREAVSRFEGGQEFVEEAVDRVAKHSGLRSLQGSEGGLDRETTEPTLRPDLGFEDRHGVVHQAGTGFGGAHLFDKSRS
jgi:hypothetical protein